MLPSTLMIVQKSRITPTPATSPPCVFASIALANPKTSRRTSSCPGKRSRIFSWRTFSNAKPLAIPKAMAMIGTMESSVKNVSAEARSWQRCSWKAAGGGKKDPQVPDAEGLRWRQAFRANPPDVFLDKLLRLGDHPGALSVAGNGRV